MAANAVSTVNTFITTFIISRLVTFLAQLISFDNSRSARIEPPAAAASAAAAEPTTMAPPIPPAPSAPPVQPARSPPPLVLTAGTKWTIEVVEAVLAAADKTAAKRATINVIGRGAVREADEVYYALPEARVGGVQQAWEIVIINMRTGAGRRLFIPEGRFDPRLFPQPTANDKSQGALVAFEMIPLPWQFEGLPSHIVVCVVLIWLTRTKVSRFDNVVRLRIREEHVLNDLNALLRGDPWPAKSTYLEPLSRKATVIDDTNLRGSKRARR